MAYFDVLDQPATTDSEEEARRKVMAMIASTRNAGTPLAPKPANSVSPPSQPGSLDYDLGVAATNRPKMPTASPANPAPPSLGTPQPLNPVSLGAPPQPLRSEAGPPSRADFQSKPVPTWQKALGIAAAPFVPALTSDLLLGPQRQAERQYQGAVQDWERGQGDAYRQAQIENLQSEAKARLNPKPTVDKPENIQQLYADAVADAQSRGVDPSKDPKVMQLADAITSLQKDAADKIPPTKTTMQPDGQAHIMERDPKTGQYSIDRGIAPPSFAQTGLYDVVEVPQPGGGMAPAKFNKRTGTVTPVSKGETPVPREAQKQIDNSLEQARNMDRLDAAQKEILADATKRGTSGPLGGGPYLTGPESMQFLANHIAMTFGGVKGARVGRDIIEEHIKARDLDQATEAAAQRVLSGGVITYSQAQQMLGTTEVNRKAIWRQAKQAAEQYGVPDAVKLPPDMAPPARPKGVPENAVWNPQARQWQLPQP